MFTKLWQQIFNNLPHLLHASSLTRKHRHLHRQRTEQTVQSAKRNMVLLNQLICYPSLYQWLHSYVQIKARTKRLKIGIDCTIPSPCSSDPAALQSCEWGATIKKIPSKARLKCGLEGWRLGIWVYIYLARQLTLLTEVYTVAPHILSDSLSGYCKTFVSNGQVMATISHL